MVSSNNKLEILIFNIFFRQRKTDDTVGESIVKTTIQKYRLCDRFTFKCVSCKTDNLMASALRRTDQTSTMKYVLEACSNEHCSVQPYQYMPAIRNQLMLTVRNAINRFYVNWLLCDNPNCNANTRIISIVEKYNRPICTECNEGVLFRQYTESELYNQLSYYQYMFDLSKHDIDSE